MQTSHRQILRATSLLGGAGVANIVISIVRNKFVALLLGPSGLGLVGLLLSLVQTASALGGLGISNAAVREVAVGRTADDSTKIAATRAGVRIGTLLAAAGSALLLYLCRQPIADIVLEWPDLAVMVGWMAPAVALSIITASQTALLTGYGKVGAVASAGVLGAALSTAGGIAVLLIWGGRAILAYILAVPVGGALAVYLFVRRIERAGPAPLPIAAARARRLISLGAPMMLGTFVALGSQFVLRAIINAEAGLHELGLFQAALALSFTYVGVLLQSISSDFYPRLSAVIENRETSIRLVNEQTETLLMLAGILVLGLIAFAPIALHILYAGAFSDAANALRWLLVGNLIMIASWPFGFCLLAQSRSRSYLALEMSAATVTIVAARLLVPSFGMEGAAMATTISAACYFALVSIVTSRTGRAAWRRKTHLLFWPLLAAASLVFALASHDLLWGTVSGCLLASVWTAVVFRELRRIIFPADRRAPDVPV